MKPQKTNEIIIDGDVAQIKMAHGLVALIDKNDVGLVQAYNWHAHTIKGSNYVRCHGGMQDGRPLKIYLHRLLLNPSGGQVIDHVDGDGLNNQRSNLRTATVGQNSKNRRLNKNNSSGFKGVHWNKQRGKWQAQIKVNYEMVYLGLHETIEDAKEAYKSASLNLHGAFGSER